MARLPEVSRRLVTTPQIESTVSGADIASPYRMVAQALGNAGLLLEERQAANAGTEGANAVVRDPQGKLQVAFRSNSTAAGQAYNRAAHQAYVARLSTDIRGAGNKLQLEAKGDPAVFDKAWNAFRRQAVRNAPPETRGAIEILLEQEGQRVYDTVVVEKQNSDLKASEGSLKAEKDLLDDELAALARNGGTNTPDYQEKLVQFRDIYQELADNPHFSVDQKEVDIALKRAESRHLAEASVGAIRRVYDTQGMAAAERAAETLFADESLALTPTERRQYGNMALADLRQADGERKAELRLFRPQANEIRQSLDAQTLSPDDASVDEAIATASDLGDPNLAMQLMRSRARSRFLGDFTNLSDADQLGLAEGAGDDAAALLREFEGFREGAYFDVNAYRTGYGSDTVTRADGTIEAVTVDTVVTQEEAELDLARRVQEFTDVAVNQVGADAWNGLDARTKAALVSVTYNYGRLPANVAAAIGTGDREEIANAVEALAANPERRAREAAVIRGTAGIDRQTLVAMRQEITQDAKDSWEGIKAGFKAGLPPEAAELEAFARQISLVEDGDFREEVASELTGYENGYILSKLPPADAENLVSSIRSGMGEDGYSALERDTIEALEASRTAAAAAIKADPIGYGQDRGIVQPPPELDFSTPEATAAGMALREKNAAMLRETFRTPDVPVFRPEEARGIASTIASGPPEAAASAMQAIASVSDDSLAATIGQAPIRDAITGAVRGNDPEKFQSALTALDQLWARAPETVEKEFGSDVIDSLQDWQAKLRYYGADQLTEELKRRDDPQVRAKREKVEAAGEELARKKDISEIVSDLSPGWTAFGFGGADAPVDPLTRNTLQADYETLFSLRYGATQDAAVAHQQAIQRLRGSWSRSEVNGGRLTLYAPETAYTPVGGSYAWMREELVADLSTFGNEPGDFSVIADRTTQAEIQGGQKASYLVMIQNSATGEFDLVRNADGRPMRYAWDRPAAQAAADQKFAAERKRIFGGGPATGMVGRGAYPGAR